MNEIQAQKISRLETQIKDHELINTLYKDENINLKVNVAQLVKERDNLKTKKIQYKSHRDLMIRKGKKWYMQNKPNKVKLNKLRDKLKEASRITPVQVSIDNTHNILITTISSIYLRFIKYKSIY